MEFGGSELRERQMQCPGLTTRETLYTMPRTDREQLWRLQEVTTWANPSFQDAERYLPLNEGFDLSPSAASVPPIEMGWGGAKNLITRW